MNYNANILSITTENRKRIEAVNTGNIVVSYVSHNPQNGEIYYFIVYNDLDKILQFSDGPSSAFPLISCFITATCNFHLSFTFIRWTNYSSCHDSSFVDGVFIPMRKSSITSRENCLSLQQSKTRCCRLLYEVHSRLDCREYGVSIITKYLRQCCYCYKRSFSLLKIVLV